MNTSTSASSRRRASSTSQTGLPRNCVRATFRKTNLTAVGFDTDTSYMLVEIAGDVMTFQTLSRSGKRIDGGTVTTKRRRTQTTIAMMLPMAP